MAHLSTLRPAAAAPAAPAAAVHRGGCVVHKQQHVFRRPQRSPVAARASSGDSDMPTMTLEKAYNVLGVSSGAAFERVVEAKNKRMERVSNDAEKLMEIETAYDLLFMQHMRKRLTGELEVSTSVRYADVPAAAPKRGSAGPANRGNFGASGSGSSKPSGAPSALRVSLPSASALNISIAVPRQSSTLLTTQAVGFSALAAWALAQALLETPDAQLGETAGAQLALALSLSIWSLTQKKMQLGKAVGCTMACLVVGVLLGSILSSWLRVDIVPLGSFASPGVLVAEFIIAVCAAGAIVLV